MTNPPNVPTARAVALHVNVMRAGQGLPPLPVPGDPTSDPVLAQLQAIGRAVGVPAEPAAAPAARPYRPLPSQDQVDAKVTRMLEAHNSPGLQRFAVDPAQAHAQRQALVAAAQERGRQLAQDAAAGALAAGAPDANVADLHARLQANRVALAALTGSSPQSPPPAA